MALAAMANRANVHNGSRANARAWDARGARRSCCRQVRELVGLTLEESGAEPSDLDDQPWVWAAPGELCDTTWCATQAFYTTTNTTSFLPTPA